MLDPALIAALEAPLPPEPPRVIEERIWLSDAGERAQKLGNRLVAQYEADVARWLGAIDNSIAAYARVQRNEKASPELVVSFAEDIAEIESLAEYRAERRAHFAKRSQRDIKQWFKTDPSIGAVVRSFTARLLAADDRAITGLLDYALFLRSVRAQHDPEPAPSPVFTDPKEMLRSLRAAVAA